jgi:hypothetical protein
MMMIKYKDNVSFQTARNKVGENDEVLDVIPKDYLQVVRLTSMEQLQEMEEREDVEYVEKGMTYTKYQIVPVPLSLHDR